MNKRNVLASSIVVGIGAVGVLSGVGTANAATAAQWDAIAQCESGGVWNLSYGDADSTGGLQIQDRTWADFGGTSIAPHAYQATKAQQIAIGEKILAAQGESAWACVAITGVHLSPGGSTDVPPSDPGTETPPTTTPPADNGGNTGDTGKSWTGNHPNKSHGHKWSGGANKSSGTAYTVRAGDTLSSIAHAHGCSGGWAGLYTHNSDTVGSNPNVIYPGQVLNLT